MYHSLTALSESESHDLIVVLKGDFMSRRMKTSLIGGALLGVVCVIGAYVRSGNTASPGFVFSLWYNRVILGLVVGAPWRRTDRTWSILRGALFGLLISFAFYSSTSFQDPVSFAAGIGYGVILEWWLSRDSRSENSSGDGAEIE